MIYSAEEKARIDKILVAFEPFIKGHSYKGGAYFDIVYSEKFGAYFQLVDVTRERDLSEMAARCFETADELLEGLIHEIVNDSVFVKPRIDVPARRALSEKVVMEALDRMDGPDRAEWESAARAYLDGEDYED